METADDTTAAGGLSLGTGKVQAFKPLRLKTGEPLSATILEDRR